MKEQKNKEICSDIRIIRFKLKNYKSIIQMSKKLDDRHIKNRPDIFKDVSMLDNFMLYLKYFFKDTIFIAVKDNYVVGMVVGEKLSNICYLIKDIFVEEEYRHIGIGKRLIEAIENYARKKDYKRIILNCYEFNKNAKGFYENEGFNTYVATYEKKL